MLPWAATLPSLTLLILITLTIITLTATLLGVAWLAR